MSRGTARKHDASTELPIDQSTLVTDYETPIFRATLGWGLTRHLIALIATLLFGLAAAQAAQDPSGPQNQATVAAQVPLYLNLGKLHYPITTNVPVAQRYFDQGLRLYYAFNHQEAIRSFQGRGLIRTAPCATGASRSPTAPISMRRWMPTPAVSPMPHFSRLLGVRIG